MLREYMLNKEKSWELVDLRIRLKYRVNYRIKNGIPDVHEPVSKKGSQ